MIKFRIGLVWMSPVGCLTLQINFEESSFGRNGGRLKNHLFKEEDIPFDFWFVPFFSQNFTQSEVDSLVDDIETRFDLDGEFMSDNVRQWKEIVPQNGMNELVDSKFPKKSQFRTQNMSLPFAEIIKRVW